MENLKRVEWILRIGVFGTFLGHGVFAHLEAEVVAENIAAEINGLNPNKKYDGQAYCFLELGYGKAGFAGGNFYSKSTPMIKMRKPGRLWHWGKILLEKYWFWRYF